MTVAREVEPVVIAREPRRALFLPLAVWAVHASAGMFVSWLHCRRGYLQDQVAGIEAVRIVLTLLTLAAAAVLVLLAVTALRARRRLEDDDTIDPNGRHAFGYSLSAIVCGLALLYLAWTAISTFAGGNLCA